MNYNKLLLGALPAAMFCGCQQETKEVDKPNILFLLVDDMQSTAINVLGNSHVRTPNIDRLITEGVTFTNTYTNGAIGGALSMPSRAMLMTGRGVFEVQSDGSKIPATHTTLPEHLQNNGYDTYAVGKWHSDFESFYRSFAGGENLFFGGMHTYETNGHVSPRLRHYDPTGSRKDVFVGEEFSSKMYADAAIDYLDSRRDNEQPFMAYIAFTSPHDPRNQLPDYGDKYNSDGITLPPNYRPEHPFDNGDLKVRDEVYIPAPRSEQVVREELALYYGMVNEVDHQIGRILSSLEKNGQTKNTIIVFASDNGLAMGQHGLMGKQNLYDHSISVPMAILDPRNKSNGRKTDALCYLYDIYPTLCDMTGVSIPESVTGCSLQPVVNGETEHARDLLFLSYSSIQRGLVKDGYKYIVYNVGGKQTEQLFDLRNDPWEMENLIGKMPDKTTEYKGLLSEQMSANNDFCSLDNPLWWSDGHMITWNEGMEMYIFEE